MEKLLRAHDLNSEVVPVPRTLSSDCGVCIKSTASVEQLVRALGDIIGIKCFMFDGIECKPGKHRKEK